MGKGRMGRQEGEGSITLDLIRVKIVSTPLSTPITWNCSTISMPDVHMGLVTIQMLCIALLTDLSVYTQMQPRLPRDAVILCLPIDRPGVKPSVSPLALLWVNNLLSWGLFTAL